MYNDKQGRWTCTSWLPNGVSIGTKWPKATKGPDWGQIKSRCRGTLSPLFVRVWEFQRDQGQHWVSIKGAAITPLPDTVAREAMAQLSERQKRALD